MKRQSCYYTTYYHEITIFHFIAGLDTKIFDWHMDSQPLTLIINVSDIPKNVCNYHAGRLLEYEEEWEGLSV